MTKRFTVALNPTTATQDENFISYLKANNMAWWRYIGNFWLLIDYSDTQTPITIREELLRVFPDVHNFVMDISGTSQDLWAGYGPSSEGNNMFEWLREIWDDRSSEQSD